MATESSSPADSPIDWMNLGFLAVVHLVALGGGIAYFATTRPSLAIWALAFVWTSLTIFALSAGYHRLFSHRSYEAHPLLRLLLLVFGAASFQNSALTWAADHRRHHRKVDTDEDPYNARRGFWWAHVGWVLRKTPVAMELHPVPDLERDRLITWQHRWYVLIGLVAGALVPAAIGFALGDLWGGFILAGAIRLVFVFHVTFSVNSFAHFFGNQPYSRKSTAKDSTVVALLSMGEGYHNFHHTFPNDYRNGVRKHHFDPSKWGIRFFAIVGLARNLRRTPRPAIARARLRVDDETLRENGAAPTAWSTAIRSLRGKLDEMLGGWQTLLSRTHEATTRRDRHTMRALRSEIRRVEAQFKQGYRHWRRLARMGVRQGDNGGSSAATSLPSP